MEWVLLGAEPLSEGWVTKGVVCRTFKCDETTSWLNYQALRSTCTYYDGRRELQIFCWSYWQHSVTPLLNGLVSNATLKYLSRRKTQVFLLNNYLFENLIWLSPNFALIVDETSQPFFVVWVEIRDALPEQLVKIEILLGQEVKTRSLRKEPEKYLRSKIIIIKKKRKVEILPRNNRHKHSNMLLLPIKISVEHIYWVLTCRESLECQQY